MMALPPLTRGRLLPQGKFAKKKDWVEAFGLQDDEEVCRAILEHGELQISEGERKAHVEKYVLAALSLSFRPQAHIHCVRVVM